MNRLMWARTKSIFIMERFFIGLGFMKCGTTFITNRLSKHPQIYMPPIRELRFWENYFSKHPLPKQKSYALRAVKKIQSELDGDKKIEDSLKILEYWHLYSNTTPTSLAAYNSLFKPNKRQIAVGEISPSYVEINKNDLASMASMLPDARVIISMRHPYKRLISQYNHVSRLRPSDVSDDSVTLNWLRTPRVNAQVEYGTLLKNAFSAFGKERIKVMFFEDMVEKPELFFDDLLKFIDVPFHPRIMPKSDKDRVNAPKRELSKVLQAAFRARVQHVPDQVKDLVGDVPIAWQTG
ncbi:sulfotransferase [Shimia sp.]|uniref:sulfotransferase family protein n=1 Tax=Shimia sp. TaxID=1954381 RepID=UPI0032984D53